MSRFYFNPYDMTYGCVFIYQRNEVEENDGVVDAGFVAPRAYSPEAFAVYDNDEMGLSAYGICDTSAAAAAADYMHVPNFANTMALTPPGSVSPMPPHANSPGPAELPAATLHRVLEGVVTFVSFPEFFTEPQLDRLKAMLTRLFIGQLPYDVTTNEVAWIVLELTGKPVFGTECIKRWTSGAAGKDAQKGCVHTYCLPEDEQAIIAALHRRVLIDDSGVWFAETAEEKAALEAYCTTMVKDKARRFRDRPYQPVVVQAATSTFVPHAPQRVLPPPYEAFVAQN